MREGPSNTTGRQPPRARSEAQLYRDQATRLRRQLATARAELRSVKRRQEWLESALASQRHARQVLEAAVSASYADTIAQIREVVRTTVPPEAIVLVVSRGDDQLLDLHCGPAWHFPRDKDGGYAGYYPADSAAAIEHLRWLIAQGGQYLLLPQTAFWWLEHYRGFEEHLDGAHRRVWRDDRCIIYQLRGGPEARPCDSAAPALASVPPGKLRPSRFPPPDRYDLICFPIIDWGYRFQRPQQLMRQFAAAGHRVFYLSHQFRKAGEPYTARRLAGNLWEVSLRGPRFKVHQGVLDDESCEALFVSLKALRQARCPGPAAAIVQLPFWWPLVKQAALAFHWPIVYDCMDYHAGFSTSHPLNADQESDLLARADLVVATSSRLQAEARRHNRQVLLLRNACDYRHFAKVGSPTPGRRPVIGYFGAIAEWFDSDLVADLAQRRPDWDFVLVGSTFAADLSRLSKLPNVSLPGEKPYAELPAWLARFNVTILPFKRTPLTEAANPVKAYEIFASGRPLISVPLPEMLALVPLLRLASTAEEFEREIEMELNRPDPAMRARRQAFARQNTWRKRFETLAPAIRARFTRKPSRSTGRKMPGPPNLTQPRP